MPPPRPPQPPQFRTQQQSIRRSGAPPPPPPPPPARSSSYFQSFKARFCFTPIEELPPPPKFEGFHKVNQWFINEKTQQDYSYIN